MSDTTLIGVLAAAAVAVVTILLFLRRRAAPPEVLDESSTEDIAESPALDSESAAEEAPEALQGAEAEPPAPEAVESKPDTTEGAAETRDDVEAAQRRGRATTAEPATAEPETAEPAAAAELETTETPATTAETLQEPVGEAEAPVEEAEADQAEEEASALKRGLSSTRGGFVSRLAKLFKSKPKIDASLLDELEEILITADIGVKTSDRVLEALRKQIKAGTLENEDAVWEAIRAEARRILDVDVPSSKLDERPSLILVAGVNGVGKTTTIGKLAAKYAAEGRRVLLAAGDTYRAAAVLQLEVWGQRVGCPVVRGKEGADPGSVIFDAVNRARDEGYDLVIADTAGRLHTKQPLMDELKKVDRTVTKALGGRSADEILLVLDATTGQNAVQQMHMFRGALGITGVVLTKLDGTAKGGVVLGIVDEHKVPVRFVGLGERVEDLREFSAEGFVKALFERPSEENMAA